MDRPTGSGYSSNTGGYGSNPSSNTSSNNNPAGGSTVLGSTTLGAIKDSITGGPRQTDATTGVGSGSGAGGSGFGSGFPAREGTTINTGVNRQWDKGSEREWNQGAERVNQRSDDNRNLGSQNITSNQPAYGGNQMSNPNTIDPRLNQQSGNAPIGSGYNAPANNQPGYGGYNKDPRAPIGANTNEINYQASGRQL